MAVNDVPCLNNLPILGNTIVVVVVVVVVDNISSSVDFMAKRSSKPIRLNHTTVVHLYIRTLHCVCRGRGNNSETHDLNDLHSEMTALYRTCCGK